MKEIEASIAVYERGDRSWGSVITSGKTGPIGRGTGKTAEAAFEDAQSRAGVLGTFHVIPKLLRAELEDTGAILFHETFTVEDAKKPKAPKKRRKIER